MACRQLSVDVPESIKDVVIGELAELSATGFWESGEPSPGVSRLEAYFDLSTDLKIVVSRLREIFAHAALDSPRIVIDELPDFDWLTAWKESWGSFSLGSRFFVIPSWREDSCPVGRIPIRMDPGQAFGTGTHETTQLTLEALERDAARIGPQMQILDLGTGSGILAIAARFLGFQHIAACDIDQDSVLVAQENVERNPHGVADISLFCGSIDSVCSDSVDLLLCNLTADVIAELFGDISRVVRAGGTAILSGILTGQRGQIRKLFENAGWHVEDDSERAEWIALLMRRPEDPDVR
jgi:ribosomal protein L11 methyltransferase